MLHNRVRIKLRALSLMNIKFRMENKRTLPATRTKEICDQNGE